MNNIVQHILIVIVPLVLANTLHMLLVKYSWLNFLNVPVSYKLFGKNKTWRGFVFLVIVNAFLVFFTSKLFSIPLQYPLLVGALLGFAYLLFELPNSYMKRKLGVGAGESHKKYRYFFMWIDKTDSAFGVSLAYFLLAYVDWKMAMLLFFICSATHVLFSFILVRLKIKSSF